MSYDRARLGAESGAEIVKLRETMLNDRPWYHQHLVALYLLPAISEIDSRSCLADCLLIQIL